MTISDLVYLRMSQRSIQYVFDLMFMCIVLYCAKVEGVRSKRPGNSEVTKLLLEESLRRSFNEFARQSR